MSRVSQRIAEAAAADAFFSGLQLSSAEVKELHAEITTLTALVTAVEVDAWDGITLNNIGMRHWLDVRDEVLK